MRVGRSIVGQPDIGLVRGYWLTGRFEGINLLLTCRLIDRETDQAERRQSVCASEIDCALQDRRPSVMRFGFHSSRILQWIAAGQTVHSVRLWKTDMADSCWCP